MATHSPLRLAELLASRLCHDLIAPIGAISSGLELFREASDKHLTENNEILNLILHSAQVASARVSFFRIAFGSSGEMAFLAEARSLLENYFMKSKLEFCWKGSFQKDLTLKGWARLLLNAVLWISECAPRGGELHISPPTATHPSLLLHLKADPLILHQGTLEALEGRASFEDLTPRNITCYLIHTLTEEINGKLELQRKDSPPELIFEVKGGSM